MKRVYVSSCCKEPIQCMGGRKHSSTIWWICSKCKKECDMKLKEK